jgi:hypothetical protein
MEQKKILLIMKFFELPKDSKKYTWGGLTFFQGLVKKIIIFL